MAGRTNQAHQETVQESANQALFLLRDRDRLLIGLEDRHLALEPVPGTKTAGWLVGHLVVTGDFGRRICGLDPIAPKEWRALFSPGTTPSHDAGVYPRMAELVERFRAVYTDFAQQAPRSVSPRLDEPNAYEPARPAFPTGRDFARYLLTGHLAYHLGQLAICRAIQKS
jgi:hypothetical protein